MKWFSFSGVFKEIKKIRWPGKNDLVRNSVQVIVFVAFFAAFFYVCQFVVTMFLRLIGVIG